MDADKVFSAPSWVFAMFAAVAFGFCIALVGCEDQKPIVEPTVAVLPPTITRSAQEVSDAGKKDFERFCLACHGIDGTGTDAGPPLAGSPWVREPPSRVIRIMLHGVRGPIVVGNGKTYNREMPGVGPILDDVRIADLITFVRHNFGESTDIIASETVTKVRSETRDRKIYWTVEELLATPP